MQFIERLLHIDPDAGSGIYETAILLAVIAIGALVARRVMQGRSWRVRR